MAGGVPPPAQLFADLPCGQGKGGVQGVEDAGLPHAGVAGEGGELPRQHAPELLQPLAGSGTHRKGGDAGPPVEVQQVLGLDQIPLVDAQDGLAPLALRQGDDPVQQEGVAYGNGPGGDDHHLVDVGHRRALEGVAPGQHLRQGAGPVRLAGDDHPVPHQGGDFLVAELPPGPAGHQVPAALDVIEAAEGLTNDPFVSCHTHWSKFKLYCSARTPSK